MQRTILLLLCMLAFTGGGVSTAAPVHPHLFFSKEELPAIRKRVERGTPKRAWFFMKERCKKYLLLTKLLPSSDLDTPKLDPLSELALAWQISERVEYRDKFLELLQAARKENMDLGALHYDTAMIFDCGYNVMSEDDRQYLKTFLLRAMKRQENAYKVVWFPFSNWGLIPGMTGLREAAVLYGHPEYQPELLEHAAELVRNVFCCFIDDAGFPGEGGDYLNYPFGRIGGASVFILKRKGFDLVTGTNLHKIPQYLLAAGIPREGLPSYFPFGDSGYSTPSPYTLRVLLNMMPQNALMHRVAVLADIESEHMPDPFSGIFYYVPVQNPSSPIPDLPHATFDSESGIVTYKSDITPDAFFVASCTRQGRGHTHEDVGNFIMRAYGEDWLTDPGYGEGSLLLHNMVAINNDSPKSCGAPGFIQQALLAPSAVIVRSDLTPFWNFYRRPSQGSPLFHAAYPVQHAYRTLVVLPGNPDRGIPPYVILSDDVKRDENSHLYSQLFQTGHDKEITLSDHGAMITKGDGHMRVAVLEPQEAVVGTDEWKTYGRFAGKKFRRVKAEVTGRYGRFVTILYPRHEGLPEMKLRPERGPARWAIDWEGGTDFLDYRTAERRVGYELMMWRVASGQTRDAKPQEYVIVNAKREVKQGKQTLAEVIACHTGQPAKGFIYSVAFAGEELHVDVYEDPFNERKIRRLAQVRAFAPGVRRVWINGIQRAFDADGDFVSVTAYSRLIEDNRQIGNDKWDRLMKRQSEIRKYTPSQAIKAEPK